MSGHNTDVTTNASENKVKWSKFVGYAGVGYHNTGSLLSPTKVEGDCFSYNTKSGADSSSIQYLFVGTAYNWSYNPYCAVCQEEIASAIANSNNVSGTHDLWVGYPEITTSHPSNLSRIFYIGNYKVHDFQWSNYSYITDLYNKNGQEVELRTVVQNFNKSKERKLKLVMTTTNSSGTTVQTASQSFILPAYGTGDGDLAPRDRNSCMSLSLKLQLNSTYVYGDKIKGELIDEETNQVISTTKDFYNSLGNVEVKTKYVDKATGSEISNAHMSTINMPANSKMDITHPNYIQGYKFESASTSSVSTGIVSPGSTGTSQTVTYYFTKTDEAMPLPDACKHTNGTTEVVTKEATCSSTGLKSLKCNDCGEITQSGIEIPKNENNHVNKRTVAGKAATCTEDGWQSYEVCDDCGKELTEKKVISKLGEHTWGAWSDEVAATCESDGVTKSRTCSTCGAKEGGEVIPKLGHDYHSNNDRVEPTCGSAGREASQTCSHDNCPNKTIQGAVIPATGLHKEVLDLTTAKESTCTEHGKDADTVCATCGVTIKVGATRPLAGHKIEEVAGTAIEATCTTDGKTADKECSVCHGEATKVAGSVIHSLGHEYVDGKCTRCGIDEPAHACDHANKVQKTLVEATCTEPGSARYYCDDCHTWVGDAFETPALGHNFETIAGKDPTCTSPGYTSYKKCIICDHEQDRQELEALGHDYGEDHVCKRCGNKDTSTVKINLSPSNNGDDITFDKTEYKQGETANVTIKGKVTESGFKMPKAVKVNGVTVVTIDKMVDKSSWATENTEYKRKMGQDATSVEFSTVQENMNFCAPVVINAASNSIDVEVEFDEFVPVYRLYNSVTSEHMFTTNKTEYDNFVQLCKADQDFWIGEGINWFAPGTSDTVVRRLYNPALGAMGHSSHYYTSDANEINNLVNNYGWQDDGAANQFTSGGTVAIWTCYNEALGSAHHYTSNKAEWSGLQAHGWDLEETKNGETGVFKAVMSAIS